MSLRNLGNKGLYLMKDSITHLGLVLSSSFNFNFTPTGLNSGLYFAFYNHYTPMGLVLELCYFINYNFKSVALLKSRRDDMIMDQLFNKQLNPKGVTY
jgi:hypothetical protein